MLVLSRKVGEEIVLSDCGVSIGIMRVAGKRVSLGITAPPEVVVHRRETVRRMASTGAPCSSSKGAPASPLATLSTRRAKTVSAAPHTHRRLVEWIDRAARGKLRSLRVDAGGGRVVVQGHVDSYHDRQAVQAALLGLLSADVGRGLEHLQLDIRVVRDA
jgi:carbon storage regulator